MTNNATQLALLSLQGKPQEFLIYEFIRSIKMFDMPDEATIIPILVDLANDATCLYRLSEVNEIDCCYIFDLYRDSFYSGIINTSKAYTMPDYSF